MELKPFLILYCFFIFSFVFFCVVLVFDSIHVRRIVVVCGDRPWIIPRHGVVFPCGKIHSWILCVFIYSFNLRVLVFFFWYVHLWNFLFLFWCCPSCNFLLVWHCYSWGVLLVWCCHSLDLHFVVVFLHSYEISGVVFIVVVRGVDIWDRINQVVKKNKGGILVVSVSKCVHAVNNACRDRNRGKGKPFDTASGTEAEEPIVTLEVSCWYEADSGFYTVLRKIAWKGFLCASAYAPNSILQCFLKSMVVPGMSVRGNNLQDMPLFTVSALSQETEFSIMREIILFGYFCRGASSIY